MQIKQVLKTATLLSLTFGFGVFGAESPLVLRCEYTDMNATFGKWAQLKIDLVSRTLEMETYTETKPDNKTSWKLANVSDTVISAKEQPKEDMWMLLDRFSGTWRVFLKPTPEVLRKMDAGIPIDNNDIMGTLGRCERAEQKF